LSLGSLYSDRRFIKNDKWKYNLIRHDSKNGLRDKTFRELNRLDVEIRLKSI
jgi:hypothetical protein